MSALLTAICAGVVMGCAGPHEKASGDAELWSEIRSLLERSGSTRDPELVDYLRSLTPEQMLAAARQGCEVGAADTHLPLDELRLDAAVSNALLCLEYYFEKYDPEEVGKLLLERAADPQEHP